MSFYPPEISKKFHSPKNAGRISEANAVGNQATFICGAVLRFSLEIAKDTKIISQAKFQTDGCGFLIASAEVLAQKIIGKKLAELHGLDETVLLKQIENELRDFPPDRKHCLDLTVKTLQVAFNNFRAAQLEEWTGEKALICTCFGVSEEKIEKLIAKNSLHTIEEVTALCNAGGGCGSCQLLIQEIIDSQDSENYF